MSTFSLWLFIGGSWHGEIACVDSLDVVYVADGQHYIKNAYSFDGESYNLGVCNATDKELYEIEALIRGRLL